MNPVAELLQKRYERIRTGLLVGFDGADVVSSYAALRGGEWRAVRRADELPYEDAQFDVVVMAGTAVSRVSVREAHRVLKSDGCLFFTVPEKTDRQKGYRLPDIYAVLRDGFGIIDLKRPSWWFFRRGSRTLTVCARKKSWREYRGLSHSGTMPLSPFHQ